MALKKIYTPTELDAKMLSKEDEKFFADLIVNINDRLMDLYEAEKNEYYVPVPEIKQQTLKFIFPLLALCRTSYWYSVSIIYPNEEFNEFTLYLRRSK